MPEYPLSEHMRDKLRSPTGLRWDEITLEAVLEGRAAMEDLRVSAEALEIQARIAERAGRPQLALSLRRAAELVPVPAEKILEIYDALRPGRAPRERLLELAGELEQTWRAPLSAALVRDAAG